MRAFLALLATPALGFSAPATLASAPVATKHAPAHAFDHILEGLTAQADGDIAAAKECFTTATQLSSEDESVTAKAYEMLSLCHSSEGALRQASEALISALEHTTDSALEHTTEDAMQKEHLSLQLGRVFERMGDGAAAINALLEIQPPSSAAKLMLANLLSDCFGDTATALDLYRSVCNGEEPVCDEELCESADEVALWLCGVAASSQGAHIEAAACFERAAELLAGEEDADITLHQLIAAERAGKPDAELDAMRAHLPEYARRCWEYVRRTPMGETLHPSLYAFTHEMLQLAVNSSVTAADLGTTGEGGLVLEFGVFHGKSIRMLAEAFGSEQSVHGFDTFSGLPIDWHAESAGSYSTHGELPPAPAHVHYHVGTFSASLPSFLSAHPGPIRLMNVDCDLYESTRDIFEQVHTRIVPGTVIVFDEYVMNEHWEDDEFKAFQEAVATHGWAYEYLGVSVVSKQAVVRIVGV